MPDTPHQRDLRIDMLRGLALVMIFINHMPGTVWENFTSRNFGFSDAAEGFVLMSGIATGLAYGPAFLRGRPGFAAAFRPWRRAFKLWWVHLLVTASILAIFLLVAHEPGILKMAEIRNILPALADPVGLATPLILLGHQFAYADILPLYIVLMLAAPALLYLAARAPVATMAGSLVLWFGIGLWRVKMPTFPGDGGWLFNPLSWQVLFVAGILTGLALRQKRRFLPLRVWPMRLAVGFLVAAAIWVQVPVVADWGGHGLWILHEYLGLPPILTSFDKTFVFLPRLLHILALAYVISALPALVRLSRHRSVAGLVLLGRNSLPVFAVSSVLAYAGQVIKVLTPESFLLDTALVVAGLLVLFLVARLADGPRPPAQGKLQDRAA